MAPPPAEWAAGFLFGTQEAYGRLTPGFEN